MGFLSQKIERSQLVVGDHIYTWRAASTYSHHGIYIGESKVLHFTDAFGSTPGPFSWCSSCCVPAAAGTAAAASNSIPSGCPQFSDCGYRQPRSGVVVSCLDCFLANGSLYRFDYGVPTYSFLSKFRGGTCTTAKSDPPEEVLHRANYLLQHGFGDYRITSNNCEHFAMYCKTGYICIFGGIGQAAAFFQAPIAVAGAIGSLATVILPGVRMATMTATAVGTYFASRYANDLGVRVDVRKVQVEDLVVSRGSVHPPNTASDEMKTANSGGDSNSEADSTNSEEERDVQPVGEGSSLAPPSIDEIIKELQKPLKADRANELLRIEETVRPCAQTIKDDWVKKLNYSTTTVEIDADGTSEEMRDVQPVGEGSSVASFIDEIMKELDKPRMADHENDLVRMHETLRSCARAIKDDFVRKLMKMDPLAPEEMIAFANSSLRFLSLFPFDEVDSLYFSVKNFIVRAYELAYEKRKVHSNRVDFNTKLEEARERVRILTEKRNCLELLSLEADQRGGGLNGIDDQTEPLISQLPNLEAERESKGAYFRRIQSDLEQTSKELSDASTLMNELEVTAIFQSSEQDLTSAHLAGLEAAMEDARARLLSQEA